jgi:dihydrodipicolinate synthase/N-acetylneuraminate lyase
MMSSPRRAALVRDPVGQYPAATVACFDPTCGELPRRKLDARRTVAFLEQLAAAGAPALLIGASTGQGHLRTVDELNEWFQVAATARRGDALLIALLRPEDGPQANRDLARLLAEHGYDVAFVRPGRDLKPGADDEIVAENMRPAVEAAAEAGLATGLYSIPDVSGVPLTPQAASRLVHSPAGAQIVAIKVTEADYDSSTLKFLQDERLTRLKIVQGWDPHLAQALRDGTRFDPQGRQRCGVTSGPMSMAVFQYLHLLQAADKGDWAEVAAAQEAVSQLFAAMQDDPRRFADLQRAKFVMGLGHPLTGTITEPQWQRLMAALRSLPRSADRVRLARSLDLMGDGPFHQELMALSAQG